MLSVKTVLLSIGIVLLPMPIPATEIAGVKPDQRPAEAPFQRDIIKNNDWYRKQLIGVTEPYPKSLKFLENQGRWYTPFSNQGMPGRYNIRNW